MTAAELERFFHSEIPISVPMGLAVVELATDSIHLAAPLAPNRNDKNTAFGGSIASLLLMAGWGMLHAALRRNGFAAEVVIQKSEFLYNAPVADRLSAYCDLPSDDAWNRFLSALERRGRARVALTSWLGGEAGAAVTMDGRYVAQLRGAPPAGTTL